MAVKSKKKKLKLELQKREKVILKERIERRRLLLALIDKKKKRVNVLARVEDTIPNVLVKRRDEEIKPTFIGKGKLI